MIIMVNVYCLIFSNTTLILDPDDDVITSNILDAYHNNPVSLFEFTKRIIKIKTHL